MKSGVNLEQAGEAETIGALICSVLESARLAGAGRRVKLGNVSLKLQGHGAEEILSVHKLAGV